MAKLSPSAPPVPSARSLAALNTPPGPRGLCGQRCGRWRAPRGRAAQGLDGGRHAALELVIVVGVEKVVLPVVLVLHHRVGLGESGGEIVARGLAVLPRPVGVAAPVEEGGGEIAAPFPQPFVDHRLQSGPVGAGFGTEDPPRGARLAQRRGFLAETGGGGVVGTRRVLSRSSGASPLSTSA